MDTSPPPTLLSIGIMAWNEEATIAAALDSLFRQSVFDRLAARGQRAEVIVVANGCTDRTVEVARAAFEQIGATHPAASAFATQVVDVREPGKCNAWNRFVHEFSARDAQYLCCMDSDIVFGQSDTVALLLDALEKDVQSRAASGRQCKNIVLKERKTLRDRVSLATSTMSATAPGLICGQLYCVRTEIARNIFLPRDLNVEDGFIKAAICTNSFLHESETSRVVFVPNATHLFEPYLTARQILNNQKRQMIAQTTVHVLIEFIKTLPLAERRELARTLRRLDETEPGWLKRKVAAHVRRKRHFWRIFPDALTFRFQRLAQLRGAKKLTHFPAACIGFAVTMIACARAKKAIQAGSVHYWPKATRRAPAASLPVSELGAKPLETVAR